MRSVAIFRVGAGIIALMLVTGRAAAQFYINVDFQPGGAGGGTSVTFAGQGALASPGNLWNAVAPSTDGSANGDFGSGGRLDFAGDPYDAGALLDSEGGATVISVEVFKGDPDSAFALNPLNGWEDRLADDARDLMRDFLVSGWDSNPNSINIINLDVGASYVIYLYGAGDNATIGAAFTIDGETKTTSGIPEASHNLTEGEDYVVFSGIASNGTITIEYMNNGSAWDGHFNGFQLVYTPPDDIPPDDIPTLSEWVMLLVAVLVMYAGWRKMQPATTVT